MNPLPRLAKSIRHAPGLRDCEGLWRTLRPVYLRLIDPLCRGVPITLGGHPVRVPAELLGTNPDWSAYEPETLAALGAWMEGNPGRITLLDIGCSFGVLTSFAVQVCPRIEVIAFDSDLVSLRAIDAVVPSKARSRVRRIEGLLGDEHSSGQSLDAALASTQRRLPKIPARMAISRSSFLCFGEPAADNTPRHRLDALLAGVAFPAPVILKCDVEGAELLVLSGATGFLRRVRPTLLLSIHPSALPRFGHAKEGVAAFLRDSGYSSRVLACDHEEHWWCEPIPQ
jgi:FkbM family methyltransferase